MSPDTDFETELRRHLDDATGGLHVRDGFWADVERRGMRRLRRRRVAAGVVAAGAVVAVVAAAALLTPPAATPVIEPAAPGSDATDIDGVPVEDAEAAAEAQAREAEAREDEARHRLTERREAERAAAAAVRRMAAEIGPITGYGDFSGADAFEVDSFETMRLVAQCLLDAGFDVELVPPGDGIAFNDADRQPPGLVAATEDACRAGLNLPEPRPLTEEQQEIIYAYQLALHQCLIDEGLDLAPPASFERFLTAWSRTVYDGVPEALDAHPAEWATPMGGWDEIQMRCPQQPVGGFGAWAPGDPVQSVDRLPDLHR